MHLTINGPKLKKSLDIAIKTIYADIKKMFEQSYGAFFQSVHIAGDEDGERTLIVWKLEDIVNMDQLFLSVLEDAIAKRYKISVKYMQRTKVSSDELYSIDKGRKPADALFGTRYMPTWKTYHFHFVSSDPTKVFETQINDHTNKFEEEISSIFRFMQIIDKNPINSTKSAFRQQK